MKVVVHTREHGPLEYEVVDQGTIELRLSDTDPEYPTRHHLDDVVSIEVSGHRQPAPAPQEPRVKEVEIDNSVWAYSGRTPGERVRVGPKRSYRALVGDYDSPPEPKPAKPKRAPKKDAA
jgi:hypothetical protein